MKRIAMVERPEWQKSAEQMGFAFHTIGGERYWDERGAYQFTLNQVEKDIEDPTVEVHEMAMSLVDDVVGNEELLTKLGIPSNMWDLVGESWGRRDPHLYGRMDFAYDGTGPAKLYELNYDTPTSLFEAAVFQWTWLEDMIRNGTLPRGADQFNSIADKLVMAFATLGRLYKLPLHLASVEGSIEDAGTVQYLAECAAQAGLKTHMTTIEEICWDDETKDFYDGLDENHPTIEMLFKLYPLEQMFEDRHAVHLFEAKDMVMLEPAWKSILSNKGILPLLWDKFPGHPNLLACHFEDEGSKGNSVPLGWVRKRLFSREGANIDIGLVDGSRVSSDGEYGAGQTIIQQAAPLTKFTDENGVGGYALVGSWVVGDEPAGMGIREDDTLITKDTARFVPHFIKD